MRRRIQLCAVFLLGSFVCVASLVRVVVVQGLGAGDVTWEMIPATIWSFCEPATAIICACLPAISTMFRRSKQDGSTARTWYGTSSSARRSEKTSSSMARSRGDTLSRIEQPDETDYLARARGPSEGSESLDPEFPMNAIAYDQTRPQARPIVQNLQQPAEEQTQNISQTSTLLEDLEAARGTEPQEVEETRSRPRTPDNRDSWAFDVLNVI
ncbi:hypothetical protein MMC09_004562 [Bachmanniomyces sp. S44760]|nr:hypothetical protein [Bachmanniomyces sp. S44760]